MRTKVTSRLSLLFMTFALMLAMPAMALADIALDTSTTLATDTTLPTNVNVGDNSFTIKVWRSGGNVPDNKDGRFSVVKEYKMAASGNITPDSTKVDSFDWKNLACSGSSPAQGCTSDNPITINAKLNVAAGAEGKKAQVVISQPIPVPVEQSGIDLDTSPASGWVQVAGPVTVATTLSNVSGNGTYGGNANLTAKLASNTSNLEGKTVAFKLNGTSVGTDATDANGVAELSGVGLSNINAGAHSGAVNASFAGDGDYNSSNGSGNLTVAKAATTTTVSCTAGPFTYDGTAHTPCSAKVTGPGGLDQPLTVGYRDNTDADTATASASYAESANYLASNGSRTFAIGKAKATIDVQGFNGAYDGSPKGASGTAKGVDGSDLSSLLDLGAKFTGVPGGTANWSFAGNANHEAANGSVKVEISKAATSINWDAPAAITYGTILGAA